jgi:hypothetical protein
METTPVRDDAYSCAFGVQLMTDLVGLGRSGGDEQVVAAVSVRARGLEPYSKAGYLPMLHQAI